ncbi:MAG: hypothetical protein ACOX1J_08810 [Dethiobacteria bacterium]
MYQEQLSLVEGETPYQVQVSAFLIGDDLAVMVYGGDKPHVGAIAVSIPRPSLKDPQAISSTTSVFALIGHKEDELAKKMAGKLASALNRKVVLTAGIHVDDLTVSGIREIESNCSKVLEQLLKQLTKYRDR